MIDFGLLNKSIDYYESRGFKRIETPWTVTEKVDNITKPEDRIHFQLKHNDKCLVASGEQSFLYLMIKGFIPDGKFQTITPCFRYEPFDMYHTKYFMKNELIITDDVSDEQLHKIIKHCSGFYQQFFKQKLEIVKSEEPRELK